MPGHIALNGHTPADVHLRHTIDVAYARPERHTPNGAGIALGLMLVAPFWGAVFAVWFWWPTIEVWAGVAWSVLRLVAV